ncbi:hypothetical protein SAMN05660284_00189 [Formivibrio citricus]|uniref:Uncharacterized protein n=2 Tax=Formivibrio citricus TaxID=83765 RepID=A0A1I4V9Z0_9NEIS|nr:hypothetical protein SAMN05660284_00189 [Formivibrio citricus]
MLSLSGDALALIEKKQMPVTIGIPPSINGCCIEVTECPSVVFGVPQQMSEYTMQSIQGVVVYVPKCLNLNRPLAIRSKKIMGIEWLYMDGWKLV